MSRKLFAIGLLSSAVITGCAAVPMAGVERDAQAKAFAVRPDKANIYVYRNELFGAGIQMGLTLDGKPVGHTDAKTYLVLEVPPGKHTLVSKAETDSTLDVTAEAGRNYFVWQEVKMGLVLPRSRLQLVDEATGRAGVVEGDLVQGR